jgi:hypothetical protein
MRPSYGPHQAPSETFLRLDRVSETYYRYIRARREVNQAEGNPFAEPVFMPTNVRGGFGIFAGRSGERIRLHSPDGVLRSPSAAGGDLPDTLSMRGVGASPKP